MKYVCLAAALATTWLALPAEAARFATPNDRSIVISDRIDHGDEAHTADRRTALRVDGEGKCRRFDGSFSVRPPSRGW
jgi:hypothetical protein